MQAYLDQHKIQTTVEDAFNACVKAMCVCPRPKFRDGGFID